MLMSTIPITPDACRAFTLITSDVHGTTQPISPRGRSQPSARTRQHQNAHIFNFVLTGTFALPSCRISALRNELCTHSTPLLRYTRIKKETHTIVFTNCKLKTYLHGHERSFNNCLFARPKN